MKKVVDDKTVYFYDDNDSLIMYIDHSVDDCIWFFNTDNVITIIEDMELYNLLDNFMNQNYEFSNGILKNYKDDNKLIWYSDRYYNPDDDFDIASVSCLNIIKENNCFKIWCTQKLDEIIDRTDKTYGIGFAPAGNGIYSKNINTNLTLQDDFIQMIYHPLLKTKNKVLKKNY